MLKSKKISEADSIQFFFMSLAERKLHVGNIILTISCSSL